MKYVNSKTGLEIELAGLPEAKRRFYRQALEKFRANTDWFSFEEFVFGGLSPLYSGRNSHLEVIEDPLYLALEDMWLQLGVQQGMVKNSDSHGNKTEEPRREETGSRQATEERHTQKARHLAAAR